MFFYVSVIVYNLEDDYDLEPRWLFLETIDGCQDPSLQKIYGFILSLLSSVQTTNA